MSPDCGNGKPIKVASQNVTSTRKFDKVPGKSDIEQRQIAQVRIASFISKKFCTSSMTPSDVPRDFRPNPEERSEEREEGGTKQGEKVRMEERERERQWANLLGECQRNCHGITAGEVVEREGRGPV